MVVTYYIKFFRIGADRRNGILMSLLLLVAEKTMIGKVLSLEDLMKRNMIWLETHNHKINTCLFHFPKRYFLRKFCSEHDNVVFNSLLDQIKIN